MKAKPGEDKAKTRRESRHQTRGRRHLGKTLTIIAPEGVPLSLKIASLYARAGAQIIDLIITILGSLLLLAALGLTGAVDFDAATAIASLIFLFIGTPYYIIAELLGNGRTPGKRLLGIRVIAIDGTGLSVHRIVVRNLMKEIEIFTPMLILFSASEANWFFPLIALIWMVIVIAIPITTAESQRLGDLIAGTAVITNPSSALLPDLASAPLASATERFVFSPAQMDLYGAYELQVLEKLLRGEKNNANRPRLLDVAKRIRRKIDYQETVAPHEEDDFLQAFYIAQRGYLEQKKLFGDERVDKHYSASAEDDIKS